MPQTASSPMGTGRGLGSVADDPCRQRHLEDRGLVDLDPEDPSHEFHGPGGAGVPLCSRLQADLGHHRQEPVRLQPTPVVRDRRLEPRDQPPVGGVLEQVHAFGLAHRDCLGVA
ncbi:hypothetical protein HNR68_002262 [Saccharopolyspora hordei]|uniref:Uncharacterized protein n=1 Tax=Saccharopolyspora hordei TaxID=1838 RepID=A0A853AGE1_9PSEU|nr:hypothetical protein [Saccharopolyspora hordei]NYI83632.1 hypothetical protein [Saccharopolyspora hordei]